MRTPPDNGGVLFSILMTIYSLNQLFLSFFDKPPINGI
ncbi:hypothetical protein GGE08_000370 [Muricauda sp. ARW1Y1]|nr:hypothetical protein [Muricauda sp. ARW1Y1]